MLRCLLLLSITICISSAAVMASDDATTMKRRILKKKKDVATTAEVGNKSKVDKNDSLESELTQFDFETSTWSVTVDGIRVSNDVDARLSIVGTDSLYPSLTPTLSQTQSSLAKSVSFKGKVWNDANGNGRIDDLEEGLAGVIAQVKSCNIDPTKQSNNDQTVAFTFTKSDGIYHLNDFGPPGCYYIHLVRSDMEKSGRSQDFIMESGATVILNVGIKFPSSVGTSASPIRMPTEPSDSPTSNEQTISPSTSPSTSKPSAKPTTIAPTMSPSATPSTSKPSAKPTSGKPTMSPSATPSTSKPSAKATTSEPTISPSTSPSTSKPSAKPTTSEPTLSPSDTPSTRKPSAKPTTSEPSMSPSVSPSTIKPSTKPTTNEPTMSPSVSPSTSKQSANATTSEPTLSPSNTPSTRKPSAKPTTSEPSMSPSETPLSLMQSSIATYVSFSGIVWNDANGNGQIDDLEEGLAGVIIQAKSCTTDQAEQQSTHDQTVAVAFTKSDGSYLLKDIGPPGCYYLNLVRGDMDLSGRSQDFIMKSGGSVSLNAGVKLLSTDTPTSNEPTISHYTSPSTSKPSAKLTSGKPSMSPSVSPSTRKPSAKPTTSEPTMSPSATPSTSKPSPKPTTSEPTMSPSVSPSTIKSSAKPQTRKPTISPSATPSTSKPSAKPTSSKPIMAPSLSPSTSKPSAKPTASEPTMLPSVPPSTRKPSAKPITSEPAMSPSASLSTTSGKPSMSPSVSPSTRKPSAKPTTSEPTMSPSATPSTSKPSPKPTTSEPTMSPSVSPSTIKPSAKPQTSEPTISPSATPSTSKLSAKPTSSKPTMSPSLSPSTSKPSAKPTTSEPTILPSVSPSTRKPSAKPITSEPTMSPSASLSTSSTLTSKVPTLPPQTRVVSVLPIMKLTVFETYGELSQEAVADLSSAMEIFLASKLTDYYNREGEYFQTVSLSPAKQRSTEKYMNNEPVRNLRIVNRRMEYSSGTEIICHGAIEFLAKPPSSDELSDVITFVSEKYNNDFVSDIIDTGNEELSKVFIVLVEESIVVDDFSSWSEILQNNPNGIQTQHQKLEAPTRDLTVYLTIAAAIATIATLIIVFATRRRSRRATPDRNVSPITNNDDVEDRSICLNEYFHDASLDGSKVQGYEVGKSGTLPTAAEINLRGTITLEKNDSILPKSWSTQQSFVNEIVKSASLLDGRERGGYEETMEKEDDAGISGREGTVVSKSWMDTLLSGVGCQPNHASQGSCASQDSSIDARFSADDSSTEDYSHGDSSRNRDGAFPTNNARNVSGLDWSYIGTVDEDADESGIERVLSEETDESKSSLNRFISDLVWLEKRIADDTEKSKIGVSGVGVGAGGGGRPKASNDIERSDSYSYECDSFSDGSLSADGMTVPSAANSAAVSITVRDCYVPAGRLNVDVASTKDGPVISCIRDESLCEHFDVGDLIMAVDDLDTRSLTGEQMASKLSSCSGFQRKITILRLGDQNDPKKRST